MDAAPDGPDDAMREPVRRLLAYMESLDPVLLEGVFADDAELVDSFPPFVFAAPGAPERWAAAFAAHVGEHSALRGALATPHEFGRDGDTVFFSQPITWTFALGGRDVLETGGLSLVLSRVGDAWRIRRYGWAVVDVTRH